jgi:hypothetical protein
MRMTISTYSKIKWEMPSHLIVTLRVLRGDSSTALMMLYRKRKRRMTTMRIVRSNNPMGQRGNNIITMRMNKKMKKITETQGTHCD